MRKRRKVVPDSPHHVVHRGNNRRRLFSYPRDYHRLLFDLRVAVRQTRCTVQALCLMANHVHLIVTPPEPHALSDFVKLFAQRYARHRNDQRNSSGKLFEGRFWSEPIKSTFHLAVATMYIDRNPVASGFKNPAEDFRWSTCALHWTGNANDKAISDLWTPSFWYLSLGRSAEERALEYKKSFALYSRTALAREQHEFFGSFDVGRTRYKRRLERPNRSSACEDSELSRYGLEG